MPERTNARDNTARNDTSCVKSPSRVFPLAFLLLLLPPPAMADRDNSRGRFRFLRYARKRRCARIRMERATISGFTHAVHRNATGRGLRPLAASARLAARSRRVLSRDSLLVKARQRTPRLLAESRSSFRSAGLGEIRRRLVKLIRDRVSLRRRADPLSRCSAPAFTATPAPRHCVQPGSFNPCVYEPFAR